VSTDPLAVYQQALGRPDAAAGFYNHNIRIDTDGGPVIVRIPIPGAASMDLTIWNEADVLTAVGPYLAQVPRLRHVHTDPSFQLHEYIAGDVVDTVAPRGTPLASRVLDDVIAFFAGLVAVPAAVLPATPPAWPADGDTPAFARRLSDITAGVYATYLPTFGQLFTALGIPTDPLAPVLAEWPALTPRPFRLVHADIHRKNMIDTGQHTVFLDWELALLGDPLYDLAVHLHKMTYPPDQHDAVIHRWVGAIPAACSTNWPADLTRYLTHERVKSAIVDTVRYTTLLTTTDLTAAARQALLHKFTAKLNAAHPCWGNDRTVTPPDLEEIIAAHYT
jgi:aminoglycoside phosphotransferase (APT) family kinase protein